MNYWGVELLTPETQAYGRHTLRQAQGDQANAE